MGRSALALVVASVLGCATPEPKYPESHTVAPRYFPPPAKPQPPPGEGPLDPTQWPVMHRWSGEARRGVMAAMLISPLRRPRDDQENLVGMQLLATCSSLYTIDWEGTDPKAGSHGVFWYWVFHCNGPPLDDPLPGER